MAKLPMNQDALVNFVLNHIHVYAQEFVEANPDYQYMLEDQMAEDYQSFLVHLDQEFRRARVRFMEAA